MKEEFGSTEALPAEKLCDHPGSEWNAYKEHRETAANMRERLAFVTGDMSGQKMTVGKHEALNWASLKSVYEEALERCPRAAHTIAWMLWHDILHADRFAALSQGDRTALTP